MNPTQLHDLGEFLKYFPECLIQTFDDGSSKNSGLAKVFLYQPDLVKDLQAQGAGVFCAINPTSDCKRDIAHLKHISALMLDLDVCKEGEKSKEEVGNLKIGLAEKLSETILEKPHYIIETKNGLQPIWLFEPYYDYNSGDRANQLYKGLVKALGDAVGVSSEGDNVVRVFRLPFTQHLKTKSDPFDVLLREDNSDLPKYDFAEFLKKYTPQTQPLPVMESSGVKGGVFGGSGRVGLADLPLDQVIMDVAKESGIQISFKEQSNGTKTIIENGQVTSGFISQTGKFCSSMSGKDRKGGAIDVVQYYLQCTRKEARKWLTNRYDVNFPFNASDIAKDILEDRFLAQFAKTYFLYDQGLWKEIADNEVNYMITAELEGQGVVHSRQRINEVRYYVDDYAYQAHGKVLRQTILSASRKANEVVFSNTVLDVASWLTRDFSPQNYNITKLPFPYENRDYKCPRWLQFLDEVFASDIDKDEKIYFVQEWFGYSLLPDTTQEKALILIGEGSNGKSVLLHVWGHLLGADNHSAIDLGDINREQYTVQLLGKLINIASDIRSENQLDTGTFKKLVSGDQIMGKTIYQRPIQFVNCARLVFATNNFPFIKEGGDSLKRRLQIVQFNAKFDEKTKNRNLKTELEAELPDILLWSVEGLRRLKGRGKFEDPDSVKKAVGDYIHESNTVALFLEDGYEITKDPSHSSIERSIIYAEYCNYCKENNYRLCSNRKFYERLRIMGVDERKSSGKRYLIGIRAIGAEGGQEEIQF